MTLSKRQPGQPLRIPAKAYNAFVDAAEAAKHARHDIGSPALSQSQSLGVIRVANLSGYDEIGRAHV